MKHRLKFALLLTLAAPAALPAQADKEKPPAENPAHQDMRAMRDHLMEAFNKADLDAMLQYVDKDVVVTWQNAEVSHGHKGIREYYEKMMKGPNKIVDSVSATVTPDDLTVLRGDREGISVGKVDQHFKLTDGTEFDLSNRYTAELVKDGDQWKVGTLQVSANVFDNPLQQIAMKRVAWWAGGIGVAAGAVLGALLLSAVRGRRAQP